MKRILFALFLLPAAALADEPARTYTPVTQELLQKSMECERNLYGDEEVIRGLQAKLAEANKQLADLAGKPPEKK